MATPRHPSQAGKPGAPKKEARPSKSEKPKKQDFPQAEPRTLPHSVEAEKGVLGSMLKSPQEVIGDCIEELDKEWFYVPAHQLIYSVLAELWRENKAIDLITFTEVLRDRKILEVVGGASFVTSLYTFVPTAANITYYREIVRDKFILRRIIEQCTESVTKAFDEQDQVSALMEEVEGMMFKIRPEKQIQDRPIMHAVMGAMESIEALYSRKGAVTGIATGFHDLDRMTGGLQQQDFFVIAGRPSMGKTALAMNIAEHVAVKENKPVAIFSLEMSEEQLMQRMMCSMAKINLQKVRDGFFSERDAPALTNAASLIGGSPIYLSDRTFQIDGLIARARRLKSKYNIELIIIDYLQLLTARGFKVDNRQREVSYISGAIKGLAKDLKVPVVVLAQLNRQPEGRHGGKPRLSDLRESGSIEQDADIVGLLFRAEVYEEDENIRADKAGEAELIIAKQRNGPTGEVMLTFLKEFTRFEDRARGMIQPEL